MTLDDPHADARFLMAGEPIETARLAVILVHGRGGTAPEFLSLASPLGAPGVAFIAPQAAGNTWYPNSFMAHEDANQPWLGSAHTLLERVLDRLVAVGLGVDRCGLVGFSQGACLAADHAHRYPRRYALIGAFTGGLIGPPKTEFAAPPGLEGTPVYLGASDPDPHVPWDRVEQSARVLEVQGASVEIERFPGQPHMILHNQLSAAKAMISGALEHLGAESPR